MIQPDIEQELREAFVHSSVGTRHLNTLCSADLMDKSRPQVELVEAAKGVLLALDNKMAQVKSGYESSMHQKTKMALLGRVRKEYIAQVNGAFAEFGIDATIGGGEKAKGRY